MPRQASGQVTISTPTVVITSGATLSRSASMVRAVVTSTSRSTWPATRAWI